MLSNRFLSRMRSSRAAMILAAAMSGVPSGFGQQLGIQNVPNAVGERLRPEPKPRKLSRQEKCEADAWGKLRMLDAQSKRLMRQRRDIRNFSRQWSENRAHALKPWAWPWSKNADRHFQEVMKQSAAAT